jgi:hypothetical protein
MRSFTGRIPGAVHGPSVPTLGGVRSARACGCRGRPVERSRPARVAAVAALVVLASSGCSLHHSSGPNPADAAYLSEVQDAEPAITSLRSDTQLIRLGHAVCDDFSAGVSYEEVADRLSLLSGSDTLPSEDLGAVITAAADNYCPQFRSRVS